MVNQQAFCKFYKEGIKTKVPWYRKFLCIFLTEAQQQNDDQGGIGINFLFLSLTGFFFQNQDFQDA